MLGCVRQPRCKGAMTHARSWLCAHGGWPKQPDTRPLQLVHCPIFEQAVPNHSSNNRSPAPDPPQQRDAESPAIHPESTLSGLAADPGPHDA